MVKLKCFNFSQMLKEKSALKYLKRKFKKQMSPNASLPL